MANFNPVWLTETADRNLDPDVNRAYANQAFSEMRKQYKGIDKSLGKSPVEIRLGDFDSGQGWSETYHIGSEDAPNPEALRIELQKARRYAHPGGDLDKLKTLMAAETTHQLTSTRDGIPFDPKIFGWKQEILSSLDEKQTEELLDRYLGTVRWLQDEGRPLGSNWESFENAKFGPMGDWLVFERLFPELMNDPRYQKYMREGGGFRPDQMDIIDAIRSYISGE